MLALNVATFLNLTTAYEYREEAYRMGEVEIV